MVLAFSESRGGWGGPLRPLLALRLSTVGLAAVSTAFLRPLGRCLSSW